MVDIYGNISNNWRVHVVGSVIQENNTSALIRSVTYFESVNGWSYSQLNGNFGASVIGQTASSSTINGISVGTNGQQNLITKDVWVNKGHSGQSVGFGGYINITGFAAGSSSANGSIGINAKPSHTISYNANGGSNAPGNQTKWYGEDLYISNTVPTRPNYTFLGWATSSGGSVTYSPGQRYYPDENVTLYAVWKLNFIAPTIKSLSAERCSQAGIPQQDGEYVKIVSEWTVDKTIDASNSAESMKFDLVKESDGSSRTYTETISGSSGKISEIYSDVDGSSSYTVTATLKDHHLSASAKATIGSSYYILDIDSSSKGIGLGRAAASDEVGIGNETIPTRIYGSEVYVNEYKAFPSENIIESQKWSDIKVTGYSSNGICVINVQRWNADHVANFPKHPSRGIIGNVYAKFAPKEEINVFVGVSGSSWLMLSIRPDTSISIYALYASEDKTVYSFGGILVYNCL